jgi:hypothetical protein
VERIRHTVGNSQLNRGKCFPNKNGGIGLKQDRENDKSYAPKQMLGVTKEVPVEVE